LAFYYGIFDNENKSIFMNQTYQAYDIFFIGKLPASKVNDSATNNLTNQCKISIE